MATIFRSIRIGIGRVATFLFVLSYIAVANAQWGWYIPLTDDSSGTGAGDCVIDESYRLHLYYIRLDLAHRNSLFYRRYDNWGHPLSAPMELRPDSAEQMSPPGVLLDRNQNIHIVWSAWYYSDNQPHVFYARMNTAGEFTTEPYQVTCPSCPVLYGEGINLVQDCTGVVWAGCGSYYCAFSENGDVLMPLTELVLDLEESVAWQNYLAVSPDNEVWACSRMWGGCPQNISIVRLNRGYAVEVVSPNNPAIEYWPMLPRSFLIDENGVFHYIILREDCGLFYQRDARNGSPPDTVVFNASYDVLTGFSRLVMADDTLNYVWEEGYPRSGIYRVGLSAQGDLLCGPEFLQQVPGPGFYLDDYSRLIWKQGSFWLLGGGLENGRGQVFLMHVPGPNEPANRIPPVYKQISTDFALSAFPNPFNSSTQIFFTLPVTSRVSLRLYDILGREVTMLMDETRSAGQHQFDFDAGDLSFGVYLCRMQAGEFSQTRRIVLIR